MLGDPRQDVGQPGLRIDIVHFSGDNQAVHRRRSLAAAVGTGEQLRIVDGDFEGERYERTDTGGGHPKATDGIRAHDAQDLPVQCGTVLKHGIGGLKQQVYGSFQQAVLANCLAHRRLECCAPVGKPDSFLAEQTSAMPRASLRSFLLRKPACSAADACRASMQITGQPYRCSPANSQAAVQPASKPIRSMASPVAAIKRAIISGSVGSLVSRTILPLSSRMQSALSFVETSMPM
jgi:hypothetical protein